MRIVITRHGETTEGLRGESLGGQKHGHLAPSGIQQAKTLGKRLRREKFDRIYSSFLSRAKNTTLEIAKYHKGVPVIFLKSLRERMPGESREDICGRIRTFMGMLLARPDESVLIVSHTGTSRALTLVIEGRSANEWESVEQLKNTAVSVFEAAPGKNGSCVLWNSTTGEL